MVTARAMTSANRTLPEPSHEYLATVGPRKTLLNVPKGKVIFGQGDPADCVFYILKGRVKISVTSSLGKEAALALQGTGDFIGEECIISSQPQRLATAVATLTCTVLRIERHEMMRALEADKSLAHLFQSFLLTRCVGMQASLIDHLFNNSEKRLARTLLLLAQLEGGEEAVIPQGLTQETLAEMIGTTRSRVSFFMNRFRNKGYIQYDRCNDGLRVHRSLFSILLQE